MLLAPTVLIELAKDVIDSSMVNQTEIFIQPTIVAEQVDIEVPLEPTILSPQSVALLGVLEKLNDSTTFIPVDQHMVDGFPIDEHREE